MQLNKDEIKTAQSIWAVLNGHRIDCNLEPEKYSEEFEDFLHVLEERVLEELLK